MNSTDEPLPWLRRLYADLSAAPVTDALRSNSNPEITAQLLQTIKTAVDDEVVDLASKCLALLSTTAVEQLRHIQISPSRVVSIYEDGGSSVGTLINKRQQHICI